jgi:F1F0 ATPase subunit 2
MTKNDFFCLILYFSTGAILGAIFFGGLWWTVLKGMSSKQPALWFFSSFLIRMGITLFGFYWVANDHWWSLFTCLIGFLFSRIMVTRLTANYQESNHAAHA